MAKFRMPWALQRAVADALGIDVTTVTRIVLDIGVGGPPRVRISQYLTEDQEEALIRIFEATRYEEVNDATQGSQVQDKADVEGAATVGD